MKNLTFLIIILVFYTKTSAQNIYPKITDKIEPGGKYIFYLHGRIIEDQGVNAVSPAHGKYEYLNILDTLKNAGFNVISEARSKDTDIHAYADIVVSQINFLLQSKVVPQNITVLGASKGAGITISISDKLQNKHVNFIIMGACYDDYEYYKTNFSHLCGRFLSIYESSDDAGSSCDKLFKANPCITITKEVELNMGIGHGFLFKPYKEWIIPVIEWANENQKVQKE